MFDLGLTINDLKRVVWSAIFGGAAVLVAELQAGQTDWKVLIGIVVGAVLSAIKNGVLADGSTLKG